MGETTDKEIILNRFVRDRNLTHFKTKQKYFFKNTKASELKRAIVSL